MRPMHVHAIAALRARGGGALARRGPRPRPSRSSTTPRRPGARLGRGRWTDRLVPGCGFPSRKAGVRELAGVGQRRQQGPGGSQCEPVNYDYPWHDTYCGDALVGLPMCPAGIGHQGQDIRPGTCEGGVHWTVAAGRRHGVPTRSYSIYVTAADGTRSTTCTARARSCRWAAVEREERLNRVSNAFSAHAHHSTFTSNIHQDVAGLRLVYAPTYMFLIVGYQELYDLVGKARVRLSVRSARRRGGLGAERRRPRGTGHGVSSHSMGARTTRGRR